MSVIHFDQAKTLRAWSENNTKVNALTALPNVIAIASGKGGVGKTTLAANLAIAASRLGKRVLALDGDLGLANLDMLLGVHPTKTLFDVFQGHCSVQEALVSCAEGVTLLPGGTGRYDLANLSSTEHYRLFDSIDTLENQFDLVLIDTAAGVGATSVRFASAAQQIMIVVTPDPTSLADAYGFIKVMNHQANVQSVRLVANMVKSEQEGERVYAKLSQVVDRFLGIRIEFLGSILFDQNIQSALRQSKPYLDISPYAHATQDLENIAKKIISPSDALSNTGGVTLFWKRFSGWVG